MTEHTLMSENRESLEVTAVTDVTSFVLISVMSVPPWTSHFNAVAY